MSTTSSQPNQAIHTPYGHLWKFGNYIAIGLILAITLACFLFIIFRIVQWNEWGRCMKELGDKFQVAPTYSDVGNAFLIEINKVIFSGMEETEVMDVIAEIAPVRVSHRYRAVDRDRIEISLEVCKIRGNDIDYILDYRDDKFSEIILYAGD